MATTLRQTFADIADAIRAKGIDGTMTPAEMPGKIGEIQTGGIEEKDVNFWRPDGVLLYSYTADEVLADGWDMPDLPEWTIEWDVGVNGIMTTDQIPMARDGWNWSKSALIDNVRAQGSVDVAGDYHAVDGKTHILVDNRDFARRDFALRYNQTSAAQALVDWGDGEITSDSVIGWSMRYHDYGDGVYHVTISVSKNIVTFAGGGSGNSICGEFSNATRYRIDKVRACVEGTGVYLGGYSFQNMSALQYVVLLRNATVSTYLFYNNRGLKFLALPSSSSVPSYLCNGCYSLERVVLPDSADIGSESFHYCYALRHITIPLGRRMLGNNCFSSDYCLRTLYYNAGSNAQASTLYYGTTSFCNCLVRLTISGANITTVAASAFTNNFALTTIALPGSVRNIESLAFSNNYAMRCYDFRNAQQVPTLSAKEAFLSMPTDCKIVVPDSLYDEWIAATNWADTSIVSHIVKASEYQG